MSEAEPATGATSHDRAHDFSHLHDLQSCPPRDALPASGVYYAFHDEDPPGEGDFMTAAERGAFPDKDECVRRSNSVWSDLTALQLKVQQLRERYPLRFRHISKGELGTEHGMLKPNGPPHYSLWVCRKTSMHKLFREKVS